MMNLQELQTIKGNNYPIKIIILNNGVIFLLNRHKLTILADLVLDVVKSGLTFPNYKDISKGFKIPYMQIKNEIELDNKIKQLIKKKGPIICEVIINKSYFFEPKVSSKKLPNGDLVSMPLEDMSPYLDREEFKNNMLIPLAEESKEI